MDTYHIIEVLIGDTSWRAGDVIRMQGSSAFMDAVVLGFNTECLALLARPYAYVSCVGTTGPTVLLGAEQITHYRITRDTKRVGEGRRA